MSIRVLIVDDSALMRRLIGDILRSDPAIEVVGTASDGVQGVAMTERLKPDVVTMDVQMPGGGGLTALAEIMRRCP
ncbi:MAG: response regulator, partial [Armatimonadetes bacterium]|nr:response regulator [Armatimonadota bacterium]